MIGQRRLKVKSQTTAAIPVDDDQLYLDIFDLQARGWTESLVKRFLGDPDTMLSVNHFSNYTGKRAYSIDRVHEIESSVEFEEALQKSLRRRGKDKSFISTIKKERKRTVKHVGKKKTAVEELLESAGNELKDAIRKGLRTPHK